MSPASLQEQLIAWQKKSGLSSPFNRGQKSGLKREQKTQKTAEIAEPNLLQRAEISPVQRFAESRRIEHLYHFTSLGNLNGILNKGILPRNELDKVKDAFIHDVQREDGCLDASSCTIGFPNYKTFYTFRQRYISCDMKWAVIALKASILWEYKCLFNKTNAADNSCSSLGREERSTLEALQGMFDESGRSPDINPDMTTNPQAEVLVLGKIETTDIDYIAFENRSDRDGCMTRLPNSNAWDSLLRVEPELFKWRADYKTWQPKNVASTAPDLDDEIPF